MSVFLLVQSLAYYAPPFYPRFPRHHAASA